MIPSLRSNFLVLAGLISAFATGFAADVPRQIDVKKLPARSVENVIVPLPNEVFRALDKLGNVNWREFVRSGKGNSFTKRPRIALLLGTVIADGFIAVEAEDAGTVKEIGKRVVDLARGLGVVNSIIPHAKAITDAADKKDWNTVRVELDRTQSNVQQAMNEVKDQRLSQLVSLGGWLRGTEVLTSVVDRHFSVEGAELLHQNGLLDYFETNLKSMPPDLQVPLITDIHDRLVEVRPLIDIGDKPISAESVKRINQITRSLDDAIFTKPQQ